LAGDKQTGVSIMYMDKGLDTGNVIIQKACHIDNDETYRSLYNKLELLSYGMLIANVDNFFNDSLSSTKQDENKVTFAPVISSNDEKII
jgi:methionyl-tRNA formyltransferase